MANLANPNRARRGRRAWRRALGVRHSGAREAVRDLADEPAAVVPHLVGAGAASQGWVVGGRLWDSSPEFRAERRPKSSDDISSMLEHLPDLEQNRDLEAT